MDKHLTSHLSPEDVSRLADAAEIAAKKRDAIRDDIERRLRDGESIPGWEIGSTKPKPRWGSGARDLLAAIKAAGVEGATIPESLKTPGEVVALLKAHAPELVAQAEAAIEQPPGQAALRRARK